MTKMLWLTDIHLERVEMKRKKEFFAKICAKTFDAAVVTGDISDAAGLSGELVALGNACAPRPVYFVLGNHDFHGSSFDAVDAVVADVCSRHGNLHHLKHGVIIPLSSEAALIGHRGWADGQAGYGRRTRVQSYDASHIKDFQGKTTEEIFDAMENLGRDSAQCLRKALPYALKCYKHVWIATHVPPFKWSAFYDGRLCGPLHLPHYTNISAGGVIRGIGNQYPGRRVTVLCGHTHSPVVFRVSDTIEVRAGKAIPGHPDVQDIFEIGA